MNKPITTGQLFRPKSGWFFFDLGRKWVITQDPTSSLFIVLSDVLIDISTHYNLRHARYNMLVMRDDGVIGEIRTEAYA